MNTSSLKSVGAGFWAVLIAFALFPLTQHKPGLPATLKADEPAYYLAAMSLARDFDLRCESVDLERLFREFPYGVAHNLILSTDDGWRTIYYGKPYLYSLLGAPFAGVFGANGLVLFNMLMLLAMVLIGRDVLLARQNSDPIASTLSLCFFFGSTAWSYVFWIHPEILNMFATLVCLYCGVELQSRRGECHRALGPRKQQVALVVSAAALVLGFYNKPMLAAIALPVVVGLLVQRRFKALCVWLVAFVVTIGLAAGLSMLMTGHPTAYLGVDRQGFNIQTPLVAPIEPQELLPDSGEDGELGRQTAGWWWILGKPETKAFEVWEDLGYFLVGRHTGLFLYQPFSLLALGLFLFAGPRNAAGWAILAALLAIAGFFLVFIPHNWHGGGGFVGNRYFIMAYPAFLFLIGRVRPGWLIVPFFGLSALTVGQLWLTPHGAPVPAPTLQAHARNPILEYAPLELSLRELPGYCGLSRLEVYVFGRTDQLRVVGQELWLLGGSSVELFVQSDGPLEALELDISSLVPQTVTIGGGATGRDVAAGEQPVRVELELGKPYRIRKERHVHDYFRFVDLHVYRLAIHTNRGELPEWRGLPLKQFYIGAKLGLVGVRR